MALERSEFFAIMSAFPTGVAIVRQQGQVLASASVTERQIECDAPIRSRKGTPDESPYHGVLDGPIYEAVAVTCRTDAALEVGLNPVWYGTEITGSSLVVAERETKRAIVSASFKRDPFDGKIWSRTYWEAGSCSTSR